MDDHEQQAILASVLKTAVDAIVIIDQRGIVQSVNPATERMFGFGASELIGQNVKILMPSPYHEQHDGYLDWYEETSEKKIIGIGREVIGKRKDGSTFPLHLAVSEVESGSRKLYTGILRDISDLKAVEQELKRLNATLDQRVHQQAEQLHQAETQLIEKEKFATLGRISGGIAHEIRNPLNAIKTSAYYLLNARSPSPAKHEEHLQRIDRQVTVIDSAVTALSDLARLPEPNATAVSIPDIVEAILRDKQLPRSIEVRKDFPTDLPGAWVDEKQLPIVLKNLIRNARDAMPDGGVLELAAQVDDQQVQVLVTDTGVGMTAEVVERLCEPFFSTKARGMGLGMAITMAILQKNHGTMQVDSTVGQGTRFTLSLPIGGDDR
ncbi:PAS domain S-box protein [Planctomycetes bacterium SV_7m_r]